jgi:hypothetical protein
MFFFFSFSKINNIFLHERVLSRNIFDSIYFWTLYFLISKTTDTNKYDTKCRQCQLIKVTKHVDNCMPFVEKSAILKSDGKPTEKKRQVNVFELKWS